jgi:diguanylate cyclase (GGDEF)-like protein
LTSRRTGPRSGRQFTGSNTRWVVAYLRNHMPSGSLEAVLDRAGEPRSPELLSDEATWSTYEQFRSLLEATAETLGGVDQLRAIGLHSFEAMAIPDYAEMLQALGSPAALYASLPMTTDAIYPIVAVQSEEVGPTEWLIRYRLTGGHEPFKAFCRYAAGVLGVTPRLFGFPPAEVVEEGCACEDGPECVFRIRWEPIEEPVRRAEYWETRSVVLEARLEALHRTVADLVSGGDLEHVLSRIVSSAARAVQAPCFVLALEALPWGAERVHGEGVERDEAARIAGELLGVEANADPSRLVVDVASTLRAYGRLAAIKPDGGRFLPQEKSILEAYARLAAAALDSAAALEEARALLELSTALAELVSTEEMAAKLVRAVSAVVDCDCAIVALVDAGTSAGRVAATSGFSPRVELQLRGLTFPLTEVPTAGAVTFRSELASGGDAMAAAFRASGMVAFAFLPIVCNGEVAGYITTGVTDNAERLSGSAQLRGRLRGLAAQAGTALNNAQLLDQVRHQALHDTLTGLPNRALILDRAEQMLARGQRDHAPVAALFIDLDNFKDVNDTLGHAVGDELLRAVAARLASVVRGSDTVGRLGGDEFVVLAEGNSPTAAPELVAARLQDVLREPFVLGDRKFPPLTVSASIGIAIGPADSAGDLLRDADIALYRAKAAGKGCYMLFEPAMHSEMLRRLELEMELRTILHDQLFLVYQPIFDLRTRRATGVEALLRWRHPTRGVVSPAEFVPLLEENGMIIDVGRWVLDQACAQTAAWRQAGHAISVSVNVSMRQLQSDRLVEHVQDALQSSGLDADALILELTETALMSDTDAAIGCLSALKGLGTRLAIDDFGTGYSSLAYLQQFPVDTLKIDRSFIVALGDSPEATTLFRTLIQLGRALGLQTLAEGIEEQGQLTWLEQERCDAGQGFLLSRPIEADAVERFLQQSEESEGRALPAHHPSRTAVTCKSRGQNPTRFAGAP